MFGSRKRSAIRYAKQTFFRLAELQILSVGRLDTAQLMSLIDAVAAARMTLETLTKKEFDINELLKELGPLVRAKDEMGIKRFHEKFVGKF